MWGIVGVGCFGCEHKDLADGKRVITTTRSHGTEAVQETIDAMQPDEVLRVGGAGHKVRKEQGIRNVCGNMEQKSGLT